MFVTYALATGLSLVCMGLFQEVAKHRRWSVMSKWWGSLVVAVLVFVLVPLIASFVSPIVLVATCSCALLALSIHGHEPEKVAEANLLEEVLPVEAKGMHFVEGTNQAEAHLIAAEAEDTYDHTRTLEATIITSASMEEPVEELVEETMGTLAEELVEGLVVETTETLAVEPVEELVEESTEPLAMEPVEETIATWSEESMEDEGSLACEVSQEWLNEQIAAGYVAKGNGDYAGAFEAFQRALLCCREAGLSDMLKEEITDCYESLRVHSESRTPDASELRQGA